MVRHRCERFVIVFPGSRYLQFGIFLFVGLAHLKGCVDPTGALPEKKVFISGYTTDSDNSRALFGKVHTKVYLSRSPCLEPTDAKLVSVIGSKPKEMSKDDWDMLCSYEFGIIIFPRAREGSTPLPCVIAGMNIPYFLLCDCNISYPMSSYSCFCYTDGDLDGDGKEKIGPRLFRPLSQLFTPLLDV
jgi:hypothetical protein